MRLWSESPWQRLHYGFHLPIAMETWGGAQSCVEKRKEMDGDREREREVESARTRERRGVEKREKVRETDGAMKEDGR